MLGGDLYDQDDADEFASDFMTMLLTVSSNPNTTIQQLQVKFKPNIAGLFKEKSYIGFIDVDVSVDRNAKNIQIGKISINFKDVKSVHTEKGKGRKTLVIQSASKTYRITYQTDDKTVLPLVNYILRVNGGRKDY
ncbi:hypothetical protein LOTGIDRAFT_158393 [Lottia gigantea]|uniref:Uncharacterized protein n=1 Tax=Lottia gigantea TaxID=225164 RepID=V4AQ10_LOTGI|nr:hypothetical protein LOTGIDRAFT_158393 [Lottia gigantea]ESO99312.1 hypothetical protein LOTGIDRAFT_158393 [Lottia gigantea]